MKVYKKKFNKYKKKGFIKLIKPLFPTDFNKVGYLTKLKKTKKNLSILGFTLNQMLDLGIHLGHKKNLYNYRLSTFLVGFRNYIHVINLEYTLINLKKSLFFLSNLCKNRANILFPNKETLFRDIIKFQAQTCKQSYIYQYYLGGILTNFKKCYWIIRFLNLTTIYKLNLNMFYRIQYIYSKFSGLTSIKRIPDCVVVLNVNSSYLIKREAVKLGIPLIGIIDTNSSYSGIAYTIFGNDDSMESIYFFSSLFKKAILEGYTKDSLYFKKFKEVR